MVKLGPRFVAATEDIRLGHAYLRGAELHHAREVLRLDLGERLVVVDGEGGEYLASIESSARDVLTCKILMRLDEERRSPFRLTLAQSLPKGDKMAAIVAKATELGAWRIIPFRSERTVIKLDPARSLDKVQRWRRVAMAASKQCGRSRFPEIAEIKSFEEICRESQGGHALKAVLCEEKRGCGLKTLLDKNPVADQAIVMIGPEGGFSEAEMKAALDCGFKTAWLGPLIFRSETAAVAAAVIFQYSYGAIG